MPVPLAKPLPKLARVLMPQVYYHALALVFAGSRHVWYAELLDLFRVMMVSMFVSSYPSIRIRRLARQMLQASHSRLAAYTRPQKGQEPEVARIQIPEPQLGPRDSFELWHADLAAQLAATHRHATIATFVLYEVNEYMMYVKADMQGALLTILKPWLQYIDWKAPLPQDPVFGPYFSCVAETRYKGTHYDKGYSPAFSVLYQLTVKYEHVFRNEFRAIYSIICRSQPCLPDTHACGHEGMWCQGWCCVPTVG